MDIEKIVDIAIKKIVAYGFKETKENRAFIKAIIEAISEA